METLFETFKGFEIIHPRYTGIVCGYTDTHFIIAVETTDKWFTRVIQSHFMLDEYKDAKYRYTFEDESQIIKQMKNRNCK